MSLPLLCVQQISLLDCDILVHHKGFHPEIESNILKHWRGDWHELLATLLQCSDSVLNTP